MNYEDFKKNIYDLAENGKISRTLLTQCLGYADRSGLAQRRHPKLHFSTVRGKTYILWDEKLLVLLKKRFIKITEAKNAVSKQN